MSKILELREKRAKAWEAAKKFLDSKRGEDGLLSAEDTAAYEKMEKEVFFLIRYCSEVKEIDTEHFRIIFRGQVYNITFIDNVKYQNKTIKLRAALEKR